MYVTIKEQPLHFQHKCGLLPAEECQMVDGRKCDLFIAASNILFVINFVEHCTNI